MSVRFICPNCQKEATVSPSLVGKLRKCSGCGTMTRVIGTGAAIAGASDESIAPRPSAHASPAAAANRAPASSAPVPARHPAPNPAPAPVPWSQPSAFAFDPAAPSPVGDPAMGGFDYQAPIATSSASDASRTGSLSTPAVDAPFHPGVSDSRYKPTKGGRSKSRRGDDDSNYDGNLSRGVVGVLGMLLAVGFVIAKVGLRAYNRSHRIDRTSNESQFSGQQPGAPNLDDEIRALNERNRERLNRFRGHMGPPELQPFSEPDLNPGPQRGPGGIGFP